MKPEKLLRITKENSLRDLENKYHLVLGFLWSFLMAFVIFILNLIKNAIDGEKVLGTAFAVLVCLFVLPFFAMWTIKWERCLEYKKQGIDKRKNKNKVLEYIDEDYNSLG